MKIHDKVTSKSHPELGVMTVLYMSDTDDIVTVLFGDNDRDDTELGDLQVTEPCTAGCNPEDALTHITEDHDEDWVTNADPCEVCGSGSHQPCKDNCPMRDYQ